jgi:hypothetical protein
MRMQTHFQAVIFIIEIFTGNKELLLIFYLSRIAFFSLLQFPCLFSIPNIHPSLKTNPIFNTQFLCCHQNILYSLYMESLPSSEVSLSNMTYNIFVIVFYPIETPKLLLINFFTTIDSA